MVCIRSQMDWLSEHAEWDEVKRQQVCKTTKTPIEAIDIGRSVHTDPDGLAGRDVTRVTHFFCADHGGIPKITTGTPISANELVEVAAYAA
jgi:hypothetical protein